MSRWPLLLVLLGLACGSSSKPPTQPTPPTPPPPPPPAYDEPHSTPVACAAPTVRSGGTNPAPDPGATCVQGVRESALPAVSASATHGLIDLGVHTVGDQVAFAVPAGTASLTVIQQVVSAQAQLVMHFGTGASATTYTGDNMAVIAELRDPAGALVFTDIKTSTPTDGSSEALYYGSYSPVAGTLTYPNTTASLVAAGGGVQSGSWTVKVGDYAYECALAAQGNPDLAGFSCDTPAAGPALDAGTYRVFVLTQPGAGIPATATIDVNLHIVDTDPATLPVSAATAPGHAASARFVESLGTLLSRAGLCLGTVTFYDAPAWARTRFGGGVSIDDGSSCGPFAQLLSTLSIPGERTLDLFLVTDITATTTGGTYTVVGIDGTIPGPASVNGTVYSGAMLSAGDLGQGICTAGGPLDLGSCGADLVAYVAAHEAGHYLGLYHTSESDGSQWDPLSGTPRCACSCDRTRCSSQPASTAAISVASCSVSTTCGGGANLMFWLLDQNRSRGLLTDEQGKVARTSPLAR